MGHFDHLEDQQFLELGAGTGRLCLMAAVLGMYATGIERISPFVTFGRRIIQLLRIRKCTLIEGDIFEHDWGEADIIYLTATTFPPETMEHVHKKCEEIKHGAVLMCVTHKIEREDMKLFAMEVLSFRWGVATTFFYKKV